jgi:hypothetical protein
VVIGNVTNTPLHKAQLSWRNLPYLRPLREKQLASVAEKLHLEKGS